MAKRGPKTQPTQLKIARGNPGKRPLNFNEPASHPGRPRRPIWLDEEAKRKWNELIPELEYMGVLRMIDADALAVYCRVWSRWRDAEATIEKHGDVMPIKDADGAVKYIQQMPHVGIARGLLQVLNRYQSEFGMTPSSRSGISVTTKGEMDLDEFIASRSKGRKVGG